MADGQSEVKLRKNFKVIGTNRVKIIEFAHDLIKYQEISIRDGIIVLYIRAVYIVCDLHS